MKKPEKTPETATFGEWDFKSNTAPPEAGGKLAFPNQARFTLGCFQWVMAGKFGQCARLKPGKVQYRIDGSCFDPGPAYHAARAFCARKNAERG